MTNGPVHQQVGQPSEELHGLDCFVDEPPETFEAEGSVQGNDVLSTEIANAFQEWVVI